MKTRDEVFRNAVRDAETRVNTVIGADFRVPLMLDSQNAQDTLLYLGGQDGSFRLAGSKYSLTPGLSPRRFELQHRTVFSEYDTFIGSCFHVNAVSPKAGRSVGSKHITHVRAVGFVCRATPSESCYFKACVERVSRAVPRLTDMGLAPGVVLYDDVREQVTVLWRLQNPLTVTQRNRDALARALGSDLPYDPECAQPISMEGIVPVPGLAELDFYYNALRTTAAVQPEARPIEPSVSAIAEFLTVVRGELTAKKGAHVVPL